MINASMNVSYTGRVKTKRPRDLGRGQTDVVIVDAQEITPLKFVIIAKDTEHDCEVLSVHLVPLAIRCNAVKV